MAHRMSDSQASAGNADIAWTRTPQLSLHTTVTGILICLNGSPEFLYTYLQLVMPLMLCLYNIMGILLVKCFYNLNASWCNSACIETRNPKE